jgi:hypothetical protein
MGTSGRTNRILLIVMASLLPSLFGDSRLQIHVGVRNLEADNRLLFAPFSLSLPEDTRD